MDKDELYRKILTKVVAFLGYRMRTRQEISLRLEKYLHSEKSLDNNVKEEIINKIFTYLEENKLIDDKLFMRLYTESKTKGKSVLGRKALKNKLVAKGINISDAADFIDNAISEKDELNSAVGALTAKFRKNTAKDMHDRMGRFLLSRGFSYSIFRQAVDYLLKRS